MRAALLRGCRTGAYFLGAFFCLWLGYRLKTYLLIHEDEVLVVWR